MLVLGVDPSTSHIGLCLYDTVKNKIVFLKTLKKPSSLEKDERLYEMMNELEDLDLHDVEKAYIEYPVVFKSPKASMSVAESLGWIKYVLRKKFGISLQEVYVQEIKKMVGATKKEDIVKKTSKICEENGRPLPETDHEADAFWIAKTGMCNYK